MKNNRFTSYTVEDLIKFGFVAKVVVRDTPYPANASMCPYDWYESQGMLQLIDLDYAGQIEELREKFAGKKGKDAVGIIMQASGGRMDPNHVKQYLIDNDLWV